VVLESRVSGNRYVKNAIWVEEMETV